MRISFAAFCLFLLRGLRLTMGSSSDRITATNNRDLENRVIGGNAVNPKRFPYYTYVKGFTDYEGEGIACGGTLIAPDVVLTAASCLGSVGFDVYVNSTTFKYSKYEYYRKAIKWIVHPKNNRKNKKNNIGLIFLDEPVLDVPPVKLNRNADIATSNDPTSLTLIGLGVNGTRYVNDEKKYDYPDNLLKVEIDTIPFPSCRKIYNSFFVGDSNICMGGNGVKEGSCFGDSGSPLLQTKSSAGEDVQIGIVSTDFYLSDSFCPGASNLPDIYTRVSSFVGWIDDQVCKFSKSKPSTCLTSTPPTKKPTRKPAPG